MDLIRCKQWGLSTTLPVGAAQRKDFAKVLVKHFRLLAPMVDALNTPIAAAAAPKRKVLFGLHCRGSFAVLNQPVLRAQSAQKYSKTC